MPADAPVEATLVHPVGELCAMVPCSAEVTKVVLQYAGRYCRISCSNAPRSTEQTTLLPESMKLRPAFSRTTAVASGHVRRSGRFPRWAGGGTGSAWLPGSRSQRSSCSSPPVAVPRRRRATTTTARPTRPTTAPLALPASSARPRATGTCAPSPTTPPPAARRPDRGRAARCRDHVCASASRTSPRTERSAPPPAAEPPPPTRPAAAAARPPPSPRRCPSWGGRRGDGPPARPRRRRSRPARP